METISTDVGGDLAGLLTVPDEASGVVLLVSRRSPGYEAVASALNERGLATLLIERLVDEHGAALGVLSDRVIDVVDWLLGQLRTASLPVGLLGAGDIGAPAVLVAAAARPEVVRAVVSRGGRPDLAGPALVDVLAPTLFIVGEHERNGQEVDLDEEARAMMRARNELRVIPADSHLIEEPGAVEQVADLAGRWFSDQFAAPHPSPETDDVA